MSKKYFARINGEQLGPYDITQLIQAGVGPDTYIWCKGMPEWTRARHDAEVCRMFRNYLYDLAHPTDNQAEASQQEQLRREAELEKLPPLFRHLIEKDGTPFEVPSQSDNDYSVPPRSRMVEAILVTLFCSPFFGFIAIFYAYKAQRAWGNNMREEAYEFTRKAKMWIGLSFFMGLIGVAILLRSYI